MSITADARDSSAFHLKLSDIHILKLWFQLQNIISIVIIFMVTIIIIGIYHVQINNRMEFLI